ncbi:hypothetical protein BpHYR1_045620 [Brachionus plicatilis]|uniref:Uncharacterized protein n=1 Tax=Brachionus plicatilis TaxID=10195 RepID=A0A3M7PCL2_BRAPC|nr:hypothetical protein BpHYR1_045620 [Brachionus plicatilis]
MFSTSFGNDILTLLTPFFLLILVIASFSTWFRTRSSALNKTLCLIGLSNLFKFSLTEFLNIHRRFWFVLLSDIANTQLSTLNN